MRRLAALLAAIVAFGLMCLSLPWSSLECQPPECTSSSGGMFFGGVWFGLMAIGFYVLVPGTILTAILFSVLRLGDASSPEDAAVRSALGETRAAAVRKAARRGLTDAAMWVGSAYALTGAVHLAMLASTGVYPLSQDAGLWLTRLAIAAVAAACLVAAHIIDALRTRRSPVEQLRPESAEPRDRRFSLAQRSLILGALAAGAAGVLTGTNMAFQGGTHAAPQFVIAVSITAAWAFGLAVAALAWGVLMPLARDLVPRVVNRVGSWSSALGAREAGAVLHARATTRWLASSRVIVVLAGLAFLFGLASTADPNLSSGEYTPIAAGVPTDTSAEISLCDVDCVAARESLSTEDGVGAIVPAASSGIEADGWVPGLTFIDPTDLDGIDDGLAARLRTEPSVVLMPPTFGRQSIDGFDSLGIEVTGIGHLPASFPRPMANRVWAEAQIGPLDSTYFYAYPAAGWTPDETYDSLLRARSDQYRWTIEQGDRSDWVDRNSSGGSSPAAGDGSQNQAINTSVRVRNLLLWGILAAVILIPIAAVATASVVRRRREDATMAALGASARTLRMAVVIEATVTAAVALASGLLGGALTHVAISAANGAMTGLYGVELDNIALDSLLSVNWTNLLGILGATIVVFSVVSWIASRSLRTLTPVEALRPATEGALR